MSKGSQVISTPDQLEALIAYFRRFKVTKPLRFSWEHYIAARSPEQNARYWTVIVGPAAEFTGDDSESLHEDLLRARFGYTEHRRPSGYVERIPLRRSSELDKKEFSEYMDWAEGYLAEKLGMTFA